MIEKIIWTLCVLFFVMFLCLMLVATVSSMSDPYAGWEALWWAIVSVTGSGFFALLGIYRGAPR